MSLGVSCFEIPSKTQSPLPMLLITSPSTTKYCKYVNKRNKRNKKIIINLSQFVIQQYKCFPLNKLQIL